MEDTYFMMNIIAPMTGLRFRGPAYVVQNGVSMTFIDGEHEGYVYFENMRKLIVSWAGSKWTRKVVESIDSKMYCIAIDEDNWIHLRIIRKNGDTYTCFDVYALWYHICVQIGRPTEENPYGDVLLRPFSTDTMQNGQFTQYPRNLPPVNSYPTGGIDMTYQWLGDLQKIVERRRK